MPTDVHLLVAADEPYAVVRLQGVLDRSSAESLRGMLLSIIADRTPPVVIDVGGLRIDDPAALMMFGEVARETADWPSGQPVVSVPDRYAPAWSQAGSLVADGHLPAGRLGRQASDVLSLDLEAVTGAARRARELITEACARWDLPAVAGPACIVATELVNNVVAHAHTPMVMRVGRGLHDDTVHLSVRDWSSDVPVYAGPVPTTSYGGRGLLLVESVAVRWGASALPDGKIVWAVVRPDENDAF